MKYNIPNGQNEILPNLLDLNTPEQISLSEFEGFLKTEIKLTEGLTTGTRFNVQYILKIHKLSLEHLYSFAGKYRDVNISKGGFPFAAARFLPETMKAFENEILFHLKNVYTEKKLLILDIAKVHGELLLIHPFREGNGRTARILANLMARKHGFGSLQFDKITDERFDEYIKAIQETASKNYQKMEILINSIFQD